MGNSNIAKVFNCKVSFLQFGHHLDKYIPGYSKLPLCKQQVLKSALDVFVNGTSDCKDVKACKNTIYSVKDRVDDLPEDENRTMLVLAYSTFQVEHYQTYISYDFQSLISEIGGLMGMTLGLAFSSIGNVVADLVRKRLNIV